MRGWIEAKALVVSLREEGSTLLLLVWESSLLPLA
jgi:hypothetical protein